MTMSALTADGAAVEEDPGGGGGCPGEALSRAAGEREEYEGVGREESKIEAHARERWYADSGPLRRGGGAAPGRALETRGRQAAWRNRQRADPWPPPSRGTRELLERDEEPKGPLAIVGGNKARSSSQRNGQSQ